MIRKLTHVSVYVLNQDEALDFYTNKLGFEVRTDSSDQGFRWLTVGPKDQKDIEIVLMEPMPGYAYDEKTASALRELVSQGAMGAGVFVTDDLQKSYEELKERGVEFSQEPTERPYGLEAVFKDNSGNWFALSQPKS